MMSCSSKPASQEIAIENSETNDVQEVMPKGLQLITESDCQTCHHKANNLLGPSYQAIANKYDNNEQSISTLAAKIINGGSGVWGETPMNAHADIAENDAREMVNYILSLKQP